MKAKLIAAAVFCAAAAAAETPACPQSYPVHLTFDDGPSATWTPVILDILKKHRIRATFFVLGEHFEGPEKIENALALVRRAKDEGHFIGYHGYHHSSNTRLRSTRAQIEDNFSIIPPDLEKILSAYRRFPMGTGWFRDADVVGEEHGRWAMDYVVRQRLIHVGWDVDSWDWEKRRREQLPDSLLAQVCAHHGGVILLHDVHAFTAHNLEAKVILPLLKAGHHFESMDRMFYLNETEQQGWLSFERKVAGFKYCRGTISSDDVDQVSEDCPARADSPEPASDSPTTSTRSSVPSIAGGQATAEDPSTAP